MEQEPAIHLRHESIAPVMMDMSGMLTDTLYADNEIAHTVITALRLRMSIRTDGVTPEEEAELKSMALPSETIAEAIAGLGVAGHNAMLLPPTTDVTRSAGFGYPVVFMFKMGVGAFSRGRIYTPTVAPTVTESHPGLIVSYDLTKATVGCLINGKLHTLSIELFSDSNYVTDIWAITK